MQTTRTQIPNVRKPSSGDQKDGYFRDGTRKIDYVLVLDRSVVKVPEKNAEVAAFISVLKKEGLQFEEETGQVRNHIYIKVHCPNRTLKRAGVKYDVNITNKGHNKIIQDRTATGCTASYITRNGWDDFERQKGEVTSSERIQIVRKLLALSAFKDEEGINQLLDRKIIKAAYPLHDSDANVKGIPDNELSDRQLLVKYWGNFWQLHKVQPLNLLEKYYGAEVAFYFAWLDFYNKSLKILMIIGLIISIISAANFLGENEEIEGICAATNITMCPICHSLKECTKYKLSKSCQTARLLKVFDSLTSVLYSVIVCFWAVSFMKFWQRKENVLKIRWNALLLPFVTNMRPAYTTSTKYRRINQYTNEVEPYIPIYIQLATRSLTFLVLILWTLVCLCIGVCLILIKAALYGNTIQGMKHIARILYLKYRVLKLAAFSAATQMIVIKIFAMLHRKMALWLTNLENPKTQTDFNEAILYKSFAFQFTNYFMVLLYSTFLRGVLYHPLNRGFLAVIDIDICHVAGCMLTVSMYVFFYILTQGSILRTFGTLYFYVVKRIRRRTLKKMERYEREYFLKPPHRYKFIFEHTDWVIQYGILTYFAVALPFAPAIAWVINVVGLRLAAFRLIRQYRRPVPRPQSGIGDWNRILHVVTLTSAIMNPLVTAFATEVIPKLRHQIVVDRNLRSYTLSKISMLDLRDISDATGEKLIGKIKSCYFIGRTYPPNSPIEYRDTTESTIILGVRLLVVLFFEHFVFIIALLIGYVIPAVPESVKKTLESQHRNERKLRIEKIKKAAHNKDFMENFTIRSEEDDNDDNDEKKLL